MSIRVGINGFGRIGRMVFRAMTERGGFDVVAINDLTDNATLAHLLKFDSVHGRYDHPVEAVNGGLAVNGSKIEIVSDAIPRTCPGATAGSISW